MKVVIFGSGQVGNIMMNSLHPGCEILAFADNNIEKWNTLQDGIIILPLEAALQKKPELVCIAVMDGTRGADMLNQLTEEYDYRGTILKAWEWKALDARAATFRLYAKEILSRGVKGNIAELGVYQGEFAAVMNGQFPNRTLFLFDTFQGFPDSDLECEVEHGFPRPSKEEFENTSVEMVMERMPHPEVVKICKGEFPATFSMCKDSTFAVVSLDTDLYAPTKAGLECFWPRLANGGAIFIHDYNSNRFQGVKKATLEFCEKHKLYPLPLSDLHGSVVLLRQ